MVSIFNYCRAIFSLWVQARLTRISYGDASSCFGDVIYKDISDTAPVTWLGCDYPRAPYTAYRATSGDPAGTLPSYNLIMIIDESVLLTYTLKAATKTSLTSTVATSSPSPSSISPNGGSTGPKGWLVGAIVGPLSAIIIGGLLFWIYLLKKRKTAIDKHPDLPIPTGRPSTSDEKLVVVAEPGANPLSGKHLHHVHSELPAKHSVMEYPYELQAMEHTYELQAMETSSPLAELPGSAARNVHRY